MSTDDHALDTVRRLRDVEERFWRLRLARVRRELAEARARRAELAATLARSAAGGRAAPGEELDLALREQATAYRAVLRRRMEACAAETDRLEGERDEVLARLTDVARDGQLLSEVLEARRAERRRRRRKRSDEEQEDRGRGAARLERRLLMDE